MFDIKTFINNELTKRRSEYINSPNYILEHYNSEKQNIESYNGRQLLEMIQNGDDACEKATEKKIRIKFDDQYLIISNNGEPFSEDGFCSILYSSVSPKVNQQNKIGQKGLGFRSILSWSDETIIYSGGVAVAFSQTIARDFFTKLIEENPHVNTSIENKRPTKYPIATLRIPSLLEETQMQAWQNEFETNIIIKLKSGIATQVQSQIDQTIDKETLVFLNNVECIEIDSPGRKATFTKTYLNKQKTKVMVESDINGGITYKTWHINRLKGTHKDKNYELAIAWNDNLDDQQDVVFSYFRTEVRFPFPALLHGTFELSANRNQLDNDIEGHNEHLTGQLAELLVQTACQIAARDTQVSYLPLQLLNIKFSEVDPIFQKFNFEETLLKKIKEHALFPTVNGKYISFTEQPIFYTYPIAKILSGEDVSNLLLHTSDEEIIDFIRKIGWYYYKTPYFMTLLQKRMHQLPVDQYAQLCYYFMKYYSDKMDEVKLEQAASIFYDTKNKPIEWNSSIFLLPANGKIFQLPDLKIHFLHQDFVKALFTHYDRSEYQMMAGLNLFGIKEYSFYEVARTLILHYQEDNLTDKAKVIELHSYLFPLYKNEKYKTPDKLDVSVPVITQNNQIKNAGEVYFSRKYGNQITDRLYGYDKSKLLASPESFGLNEDEDIVKDYFDWLGVARYPRRIQIDPDQYEYKQYAMRNSEYRKIYYRCSAGSVQFIDDLENVLQHADSETILAWISLDTGLLENMENDYEPSGSYVSCSPYNTRKLRYIHGKNIKSYLKWYLARSKWMQTKTPERTRREPSICTTSETISSDFSPLIEKVNIDYSALIFKANKITREKVDYLLFLVGVNKTISTFPTKTIYSILNELPQTDPEGKKAKNIYRELAANYEEKNLDEEDEEYKRFKNYGQVLCKKHNEYSYQDIESVYYVNNKSYGESIISQFHTIEIEKRRGVSKIRKLFGVEPLGELKIKLRQEPTLHPLNSIFEQDFETFKPYVYVFRQETDTQGRDKKLIRETRFKLVTDLQIQLDKSEIPEVDLGDYEYVYLKKEKIIYIKTPGYLINNLDKLKDDIPFCSAISEAFSSLIDVDVQRLPIRELYSKLPSKRDDIIRAELDDNRLEKLTQARNRLGIVNDPVIQFWNSLLQCFPGKKLKENLTTEQELQEDLQSQFPVCQDIIKRAFPGQDSPGINYTNYNEESSVRIILEFLKATGITLNHLNKFLYPTLDISEAYDVDFDKAKNQYQTLFKQWLYLHYQETGKEKVTFLKDFHKYRMLQAPSANDTHYDATKDLMELLNETFDCHTLQDTGLDLNTVYSTNKQLFLSKIADLDQPQTLAQQFLEEKREHESLLYFETEIEKIASLFRRKIATIATPSGSTGSSQGKQSLSVVGTPFLYHDLKDLRQQLESTGKIPRQAAKIKIHSTVTQQKAHQQIRITSGTRTRVLRQQTGDVGFVGEWLVYEYLKQTLTDKYTVEWVSGNAKSAEINPDGDDSLGYDICYTSNDGKQKYVEVKVVNWENSFHISANEVKFGEKKKKHYDIYLVRNISETATLEIIQSPFDYKGGSFNDNNRFTVINDSYILKFDKE